MKKLNLSWLESSIRSGIRHSLRDSGKLMAKAIADEFKDPKKSGVRNKRNQYAGKRSALGQSLAKDSGEALSNLNYSIKNDRVVIGIAEFENNYVKYHEENGRPTIAIAYNKNKSKIESIFRRNISNKIKK